MYNEEIEGCEDGYIFSLLLCSPLDKDRRASSFFGFNVHYYIIAAVSFPLLF